MSGSDVGGQPSTINLHPCIARWKIGNIGNISNIVINQQLSQQPAGNIPEVRSWWGKRAALSPLPSEASGDGINIPETHLINKEWAACFLVTGLSEGLG